MERLNETRTSAVLTERFGVTFLEASDAASHAGHATSLLVGVDADVQTCAGQGRVVLVPAHTAHRARSPGPTLSFTFDPELCPSVAGFARAGGARVLDGALAQRIRAMVHAERGSLTRPATLAGLADELAAAFSGPAPRIDRRVARVVEVLRDPEVDRVETLATLKVSRAHLRELFARDVGVAMRTYVLWRRLLHAIARVGPLDFTSAAHAAGFADLAHFSRTCRRMVGYSPSELRGRLVT